MTNDSSEKMDRGNVEVKGNIKCVVNIKGFRTSSSAKSPRTKSRGLPLITSAMRRFALFLLTNVIIFSEFSSLATIDLSRTAVMLSYQRRHIVLYREAALSANPPVGRHP